MKSKFATHMVEALYELVKKDASEIAYVCEVSDSHAEIKLMARLVGNDKFYELLGKALNVSDSTEYSFNRLQHLKTVMLDAVKTAYIDEAAKIAKERIAADQQKHEDKARGRSNEKEQ